METIWEHFRDRFGQMEIADEENKPLDQRRARVTRGKSEASGLG
jgi:hypothetical protein